MKKDKASAGTPANKQYPRKKLEDGVEWMADGADLLGSYGWPFVVAVVRCLALVTFFVFSLFGLNFESTKKEDEPTNPTGKRSTGK